MLSLCNRETLVYDLRNVPGTFAQIIEVPNLFKGVNVIDIRIKWFGIFASSSYRGSICPTGAKIGSSYRDRSSENSRVREIGGEIKEGASNGPLQFESAQKIWPLLELLAKIRCVLACSDFR